MENEKTPTVMPCRLDALAVRDILNNWFIRTYPGETQDFDRLQYNWQKGWFEVVWETRKEKGYITKKARSRYVFEKAHGIELSKDELVIHKNDDPADDRLDNIIIMKKADYCRMKRKKRLLQIGIYFVDDDGKTYKKCTGCGSYLELKFYYLSGKSGVKPKCPACLGTKRYYKPQKQYEKRISQ